MHWTRNSQLFTYTVWLTLKSVGQQRVVGWQRHHEAVKTLMVNTDLIQNPQFLLHQSRSKQNYPQGSVKVFGLWKYLHLCEIAETNWFVWPELKTTDLAFLWLHDQRVLLYFVGKGGRWHRVQVQGAKQLLKVLLPMLFVLLRPPVNINHTLSELLFKHALTDSIKSNLVLLSVLLQPPVKTDHTPSVLLFKHEQTQSNPSSAAVLSSSVHLSTLITHRVFLFLNMNKQMQIKSIQRCCLASLCPPVNTDHKSSVFLSKHKLKGSMKSTLYCLLYTHP